MYDLQNVSRITVCPPIKKKKVQQHQILGASALAIFSLQSLTCQRNPPDAVSSDGGTALLLNLKQCCPSCRLLAMTSAFWIG